MKIITNLLKDARDEWLVRTTATINSANPIVDRIMDDDSVEGVIMTNKEGAPILTNMSVTSATNYGRALHKFGQISQIYIKELNPLEEIIIIRIHTKKDEIMVAPDSEFNIMVIQHARSHHKPKDKKIKDK
ncbi:dynein light chain roadblock-type 1 [Helicoverpa armigera]|uniref:dynein light chain roadblock-type 1 n=1 Tax=Helicoverpa armigera TaxID=29058 RepID=UPI0021137FC1|nr:dynein light chain roadblock-type 1 [Helicoverpa armigera]XP_021194838.2 dynein light chain roadblock-type 1 [Helicoverpa armigera]XP_021194839.2 dynein light chain roadblock-type 1 [Helicoverpa armigera]